MEKLKLEKPTISIKREYLPLIGLAFLLSLYLAYEK